MPNTRFNFKTTDTLRFLLSLLIFAFVSPPLRLAQQPQPQQRPPQRILTQEAPKTNADKQAPTGQRASRPELVLQTGVAKWVVNTAFSPDGRLLASMDVRCRSIKLWEVSTGRELYEINLAAEIAQGIPVFAFNPDGASLFTFSSGTLAQWDTRSGRQIRATNLNAGPIVVSSGFSADGRFLVTTDLQSGVVWDVGSGRKLNEFKIDSGKGAPLTSETAFSPDGRMLATNSRLYSIQTGVLRPDASNVWQDVLTLRDATSGRVIRTIKISEEKFPLQVGRENDLTNFLTDLPQRSVRFSPDGRAVAVAFHDVTKERSQINSPVTGRMNRVRIWDVSNGRELIPFDAGSQGPEADADIDPMFTLTTNTLAFSNGYRQGAIVSGKTVKLFDPSAGRQLATITNHAGEFRAVRFSADGKLLATASDDKTIKIWDVSTATITGRVELARTLGEMAIPVESAAFSKDGRELAVGGSTAVSVWEFNTGAARRTITKPAAARAATELTDTSRSAFSAGGQFVAAQSGPNEVKLWETRTGREVKRFPLSPGAGFVNVGVSPDGKWVALAERTTDSRSGPNPATDEDFARILKTGEESHKASERGDIGTAMEIQNANSGWKRGVNVKLWDIHTASEPRSLPVDPGKQEMFNHGFAFSFNNGGRLLASGRGGPSFKINETAGGRELFKLSLPRAYRADSLAWSADSRLIASSQRERPAGYVRAKDAEDEIFTADNYTIKLWDAASGRELRTMPGHTKYVVALAFSPDSRVLASGGHDTSVKLWDTATGREIATLNGHSLSVKALSFSEDGKLLVSGSDDGSARLWDVQSGETLATLVTLNGGADWLVVTPDGLFDGTPGSWGQILWRFNPDNIFDVAPVEIFFNDFFHPGLLADIASGKRPRAEKDVALKDRRQPALKLSRSDSATSRTIKVKIEVSEPASANPANPTGARDVRLFRNGTLVKFWRGDALKGQKQAALEAEVTIVAGDNRLVAYAFNRDGVKSSDAALTVTGDSSLRRKGVAYVIACGVNQYANTQYNLKYAVADATSFAEEIRAQQTKLQEYERVEIIPLLDREATKANILLALKRLSNAQASLPAGAPAALSKVQPAQPEDAVLIFFAGHGAAQGARFYLIPHDLGYAGARNALTAQAVQTILSRSVSDLELEAALEGVDAGRLLFVLDACNSGQALEAEEKRRGPMNSTGLAQLAYEKGMYILTAAQSYQAALEAAELGHGYLTFALIEDGLKRGLADKDPKDGLALAREWFSYAEERVPQMQEREMQSRLLLDFAENEAKAKNPQQRSIQRPRVFYRRELEARPFVVAKP